MAKSKVKAYPRHLKDLMAEKTKVLSQAQALSEIGIKDATQPLWKSAASYEERIAPLLDALGRELEAAAHRISAASCYRKAGDLSRAANLYRAALASPLRDGTRREVTQMLSDCLAMLTTGSGTAATDRRIRKLTATV